MVADNSGLAAMLDVALADLGLPVTGSVSELCRLSGGANNETWTFKLGQQTLVWRRRPFASEADDGLALGLPLSCEATVIGLAAAAGVPVPHILASFDDKHPLGESYVMTHLPGEALPQRWLLEPAFEGARSRLAHQCGVALATIHHIDVASLPAELPPLSHGERLDQLQQRLHQHGDVSPVMQLSLNWLIANAPEHDRSVLVHGDFRTGNLLVTEHGLSGVLDWELAHRGLPAEDLGYLCANVWRFGQLDKPVGGFGHYADLLDGYSSVAGWAPTVEELHYWEVYAALGWGLVCLTMGSLWHSGADKSLERAAVARRRSEAELDLLLLLEGRLGV